MVTFVVCEFHLNNYFFKKHTHHQQIFIRWRMPRVGSKESGQYSTAEGTHAWLWRCILVSKGPGPLPNFDHPFPLQALPLGTQ